MVEPIVRPKRYRRKFVRWLLTEDRPEKGGEHPKHPWWQVMCLTGVDYFSTLGYQPGIAALAAGSLSPIATLILVLLTLFGALPIYRRVATISPHGEGSIAMLEHLLSWWQGKLFVLCLLGFLATDFIITITLSAADATAHIVENPLVPEFLHHQAVGITLFLIALLGGVFLKGFREAIGIAVFLVIAYLFLNFITISVGIQRILQNPSVIADWQKLLVVEHSNPLLMLGIAALLFPKLALGLSGFETGVSVMPLVKGNRNDTEEHPRGRILNTYKLLTTAAVIMSVFLLTSSLVTTLLIPQAEFQPGGAASGRALAYLAHQFLGNGFGTIYDLSTIFILWFAGASAMAGLLNIVPRYLPRYGMAPNWARATRPLVLICTAIAFVVTILFNANVDAQGGAYATGVLVLMSSAAFAVTLAAYHRRSRTGTALFGLITLIFMYTTVVNIIERPDGVKIAAFFIGTMVITSLISRVWRSTEIRAEQVQLDEIASGFIAKENEHTIRLIAHRRRTGSVEEYFSKEQEIRSDNHIPPSDPVLFLEVQISDASEFVETIRVEGEQIGDYRILRTRSAAVPNAIAAILLEVRNRTGNLPHAYFGWAEGNPIQYLLRFLLFGEGDTAVVTREVLRRAEKDPDKRPSIHVGG
ncbi:amino acid transporter [Tumidithrix elongata RA019]|uniref:Amino acid transporter n=1 Tax=Tumidithrix elongata BACA0141 TaxID=2716417 RepID=A0AAW9Q3M0_9CYAN|nr:amino acid transporter [Tumidithrix elongata RA019]